MGFITRVDLLPESLSDSIMRGAMPTCHLELGFREVCADAGYERVYHICLKKVLV